MQGSQFDEPSGGQGIEHLHGAAVHDLRNKVNEEMIYSKTCKYAIRALTYMTTRPKDAFTMIHEVNEKTGVPGPYIAKIFQSLVRSGILKSRRGPTGGFAFKKKPEKVSLLEIIEAIDDAPLMEECVMGLDQCSCSDPCRLHEEKSKILKELELSNLFHVAKGNGRVQPSKLNPCQLAIAP